MRIAVALTGASGAPYGLRLVQVLLKMGYRIDLMLSKAAHIVLKVEEGLAVPSQTAKQKAFFLERFGGTAEQLNVYGPEEWTATLASGSNFADAMVVCPCTTGTMAAIAGGLSNSLIERAADVAMKEQRKLILVVRETPLSAIQLDNMAKLAKLGVCIMPASPGFYHQPQHVDELVDFMVARVLDQLGISHSISKRWGE